MYDGTVEKVIVFGFPTEEDECRKWTNALPNIIHNVKKTTGVCEKHWPTGYERMRKKGFDRPKHPPSVFHGIPATFSSQTLVSSPRETEKRKVDFDSRNSATKRAKIDADTIENWEDFVAFCKKLNYNINEENSQLSIYKISPQPPSIVFSIIISKDFSVVCYNCSERISVRNFLGFSAKLQFYSQIEKIVDHMNKLEPNLNCELSSCSSFLSKLCGMSEEGSKKCQRVKFLCNQLEMNSNDRQSYSSDTMREAMSIFLRGRGAYEAVRELLIFPHKRTIKRFFGKLGTRGSIDECTAVIRTVFEKLKSTQKHCKILLDEIHIKPGVQYQGGHLFGFSVDKPDRPAKTILALMVAPLLGVPAFVARLIPIFSLTAELQYEQVNLLLKIVHACDGYVFLVMNDSLKSNQKMFSLFHQNFESKSISSIKHPIENDQYCELFLLYDPVHLVKNIRNNWCTEKMKMLKFFDKEKDTVCTASWSDLVNIYKKESEGIVTLTTISYAALYPTNFDKQKVSLALQIFNEKVPPLLRQQGAHETARFVELVMKLWSMLNIRTPSVGIMKNDMNREPFKNIDDARLGFMSDMATMFKQMDTSSASQHTRVMGLTSDTSNALHMTLNGLTTLILKLLSKMSYVLTAELQSDRLEGEFGIYRQLSGGNFHISALQVFNGL